MGGGGGGPVGARVGSGALFSLGIRCNVTRVLVRPTLTQVAGVKRLKSLPLRVQEEPNPLKLEQSGDFRLVDEPKRTSAHSVLPDNLFGAFLKEVNGLPHPHPSPNSPCDSRRRRPNATAVPFVCPTLAFSGGPRSGPSAATGCYAAPLG
jgi:hypothetical protein